MFCFVMTDGKIEQCVYVKFCMELSKSTTKTLEMLCEAFDGHSLSQTEFLNDIHVSRPVDCQLKLTTFRVTKHQQNNRKH
jgi:hypothetical protein